MSLDGAEYVLSPEVGSLDGAGLHVDGMDRESVVVEAFIVPRGSGTVVAVVGRRPCRHRRQTSRCSW